MHRNQTEFPSHPERDLRCRPYAAVGWRIGQTRFQLHQQFRGKDARRSPVVATKIAQGLGAARVVAPSQLLDPPQDETRGRGNLGKGSRLRQKPNRLEMPRRDSVRTFTITLTQRRDAQVLDYPAMIPSTNHDQPD